MNRRVIIALSISFISSNGIFAGIFTNEILSLSKAQRKELTSSYAHQLHSNQELDAQQEENLFKVVVSQYISSDLGYCPCRVESGKSHTLFNYKAVSKQVGRDMEHDLLHVIKPYLEKHKDAITQEDIDRVIKARRVRVGILDQVRSEYRRDCKLNKKVGIAFAFAGLLWAKLQGADASAPCLTTLKWTAAGTLAFATEGLYDWRQAHQYKTQAREIDKAYDSFINMLKGLKKSDS